VMQRATLFLSRQFTFLHEVVSSFFPYVMVRR
jgi:hypothetical protein